MSVNFRYIDYGIKFLGVYSTLKDKREDNLYIFLDNRMKDIFSKRMLDKLFEESPTLVTMEEFKERVFYTDKVILKEAKRILAFFKCIPQDIKEDLGIITYYDVIDLANNFFAYYRELILNKMEEIEEFPHWQRKYLGYFSKIKIEFDKLCKEYNYIPSDWIEDQRYYDDIWIRNFSRIVFVDIVEFPKVYIDIIKELGKNREIEIALQMKKGDFNEEIFKLNRVEIPERIKNIEVYNFSEDLEEALTLIHLKSGRKYEIYSPVPEKNIFSKILPSYFVPSQNFTMNDTKLYKFLNIQMNILSSEEEKLGKTYGFYDILSAFEEKIFKEYYNISEEEFVSLNNCAVEGYKYISRKILQDSWFEKNLSLELLEKLNEIIFDLESINSIFNSDDLYRYFKEHIKIERFIEENLDNKDILDKFFEIFGIIKSNEFMKIHSDFNEYFGTKMGISLYKLLIQYMKDLAIKSNIKYGQDIALIKGMEFVRYSEEQKEVNYFLDITDEYLPKKFVDNLILTEKQRKDLGLTSKEEKREVERYRFFQAIFSGNDSVIFTKRDENKGIEISPFLEEIILKYSIPLQETPIKSVNALSMLRKALVGVNLGYEKSKDERYRKDIEDFKDRKLQLGAYDYEKLLECPLRFYFANLEGLTHIVKFEDKDISSRILGIIVHKVLEEYVNSIWKKVLQEGIFEVEYEEILKRLESAFKRERAKIPLHMDNYCEAIMIPMISKNIVRFFKDLKNSYEGIKIKRFQSERSSYEDKPFYSGDIDVYLRGRADLIIESDLGNEIVDYKTGNKTIGQLDYYAIILYGEVEQTKKMVFNAWKGRIERENKVVLSREKLEESIKDFVESEEYLKSEKETQCKACEYYNICGRGRE